MTRGAHIAKTAHGFAWNWDVDADALDAPVCPIALSAAELLISEERQRIGQCADDRGCGWLFLDTSKNHSRRWCDINDCGNRLSNAATMRARASTRKKRWPRQAPANLIQEFVGLAHGEAESLCLFAAKCW